MAKPVIGISGADPTSTSVQAMRVRVEESGGTPLVIASHENRKPAGDIGKLDALIIMGNNFDIDPNEYLHRYENGDPRKTIHPKTKSTASTPESAARAAYEKELIALAFGMKMPLFAICGGMQQLNIWCGGTLHQHIPDLIGHERYSQNDGRAAASPVTAVSIVPDSLLARVAAESALYTPGVPPLVPDSGTINSFHHQSVDILGANLVASAFSDSYTHPADGSEKRLIEAIEPNPKGAYKDQFVLGVQWHPEFLPDNATTVRILDEVTREAAQFVMRDGRTHPPHEAEKETMLSALPFLKHLTKHTHAAPAIKPSSTPPTPGAPKGRGR